MKRIKGSTKAQTVLSPAKYPAPESLPSYRSLLATTHSYGTSAHIPKHNRYHLNSTEFSYAEPLSHTAQQVVKDYSGKTFTRKLERSVFGDVNASIPGVRPAPLNLLGVGPYPAVAAVSNMLLFNTEFNPYRSAFQPYDPLEGQEKPKQVEEKKIDLLGAQPATILEGDQLLMASMMKISYVPDLGDVPVFELPDQLPDLPGVADLGGADRTSWSSGIAPSLMGSNAAFMDLPDVNPAASAAAAPISAPTTSAGGAPPPPPPPSGAPPPPPPPPPGGAPPPPPPPAAKPQRDNIPPPESSGDARQDLLASIRAGKSLRRAGDEDGDDGGEEDGAARRKRRAKAPPPPPKGNSMMGMFGDLITALDRRRKGMMAQGGPRNDEPASAPAVSVPTLDAAEPSDAAVAEPSGIRLVLPENVDAESEDNDDDAEWLEE